MSDKPCHVYIMCFADGDGVKGPCKIGTTTSLISRIAALQTGSPQRIVFLGAVIMGNRKHARGFEAILHTLLGKKRLSGEWFDIQPPEAASFLAHMSRMAFEEMGVSGSALEDICEKSGATNLQRYFVSTETGRDAPDLH